MKPPLFSILIATINRVEPVLLTIHSFLEQKGIGPNEIEIVVADSSKDDQLEKRLMALNDQRIVYVRTPNNDPSVGWDFAYKQSHGKYIYWFGDDDYLLPGALKLFKDVFERTKAEVVTAQYMYYYDNSHYRQDRRNCLGVIFFDGKEYRLDPQKILQAIYSFKSGGKAMNFRFAALSTVCVREVCERAIDKIGVVALHGMRTYHSQQPILFSLANSCVGISVPVALVSRSSSSMSQNFSLRRKKINRPAPVFKYSPVSGDLLRNHLAESYLAVKSLLPDKFNGIDFDMDEFLAYRYGPELFFSNLNFRTTRRLWKELFFVVKTNPSLKNRERVFKEVKRLALYAYLAQPLKSFGVWNWLKDAYRKLHRTVGKDKRVKPFGSSEYLINLKQYDISDIQDVARDARKIVLEKTGIDIISSEPTSGLIGSLSS